MLWRVIWLRSSDEQASGCPGRACSTYSHYVRHMTRSSVASELLLHCETLRLMGRAPRDVATEEVWIVLALYVPWIVSQARALCSCNGIRPVFLGQDQHVTGTLERYRPRLQA